MNLKPLRSTIFVKLETPIDEPGQIILSSGTKTEPYARVISVGPGTPDGSGDYIRPPVNVGDRILLLSKDIGKDFTFNGEKFQAIDESIIIGVVDEPSKIQ